MYAAAESLGRQLTLSVQVHGQVLEDVHVCRVRDGAHGGGAALVVDVGDGLRAHVQDQGVDQLDVVAVARLVGHLPTPVCRSDDSARLCCKFKRYFFHHYYLQILFTCRLLRSSDRKVTGDRVFR